MGSEWTGASLSDNTNSDRNEQVHSETIITKTGDVTRTVNERPQKTIKIAF